MLRKTDIAGRCLQEALSCLLKDVDNIKAVLPFFVVTYSHIILAVISRFNHASLDR